MNNDKSKARKWNISPPAIILLGREVKICHKNVPMDVYISRLFENYSVQQRNNTYKWIHCDMSA